MCNPVAIVLGVATAAQVGGQLYGARSQRKAAEQQSAADAEYIKADSEAQARMLNMQADQIDRQAEQVRESADISKSQTLDEAKQQARLIRKAASEIRSTTKAGYAGAGVRVGEGSARVADEAVLRDSEQDAAMQILGGQRVASSIEREASQDIQAMRDSSANLRTSAIEGSGLARQAAQATINAGRTAARNYNRAGWINAGSTVLSAAASYGRWNSMMKTGGKT